MIELVVLESLMMTTMMMQRCLIPSPLPFFVASLAAAGSFDGKFAAKLAAVDAAAVVVGFEQPIVNPSVA